jgi:hypothetical protein
VQDVRRTVSPCWSTRRRASHRGGPAAEGVGRTGPRRGGPHLAAEAFKAGLVDEVHLFLVPSIVGGGDQALPDHVRLSLELLGERRFGDGTVYLRCGRLLPPFPGLR